MEVVDPATTWIAEDDVLLKNAIEAGASLEALAKGAVSFSRRFTLRELRDRWHSLLYDPGESAKASIRMSEVENSYVGHASKLCKIAVIKESGEKINKRKTESIRKKYYAMRKRIRGQTFEDNGFDLFGATRVNGHAGQGLYDYHQPVGQLGLHDNYLLGDHLITNSRLMELGQESMRLLEPVGDKDRLQADVVNMKMLPNYNLMYSDTGDVCPEFGEREQHCFNSPISDSLTRLHSIGLSSPTSREPLWKMTEDVSAPVLPISVNPRDKIQDSETLPDIPDEDHDCLLNSANEGALLFMDVHGSASVDKSCYDNLNSLLLSSPIYTHDEFVPNVCGSITKDSGLTLATSAVTSPTTLDISANPVLSGACIQNNVCLELITSERSSVQKTDCSDIEDLDIPCILNTEVEEVPNNDDIFPIGVVGAMQTLSQNTNETVAMIVSQKGNERVSEKKIENPSQPVIVLGARPTSLLKASSNHATKSSIKAELPDANSLVGKHAKNSLILQDNRKAVKSSSSGAVGDIEGKPGNAEHKKPNAPDSKFGQLPLPEHISEPLSPDEEEFESDDDVPYFSDVEAMVLEMDLCANDQDPFTCTRVSQYQDEGAKKQIVRLEQCARSYTDKRIETHGALAVLYGRRLKYYISKSEVILGRSTEDMEVDVDLAKEGRANKVSRQQASIKLEADGSFTVKNLGKHCISVNGTELGTGQFMTLSLSNLIEIRGMSFVFEANHKSVHRFLASIKQASRSHA
uniref:FHA domain-containing protein n=1 Tax=Kalanchoe fedtschenkoi TaxID=63787 RepID=A0A7N0UII5_KALFE